MFDESPTRDLMSAAEGTIRLKHLADVARRGLS
jgi:hypothetical protein